MIVDDRFDEMRRAWIARHQGWSTIQRRRVEQLGRTVRARQRAAVRDFLAGFRTAED